MSQNLELAAKAHLQKKIFIERLIGLGNKGPQNLLAMNLDGESYLRMRRASFLVGMLGLNELVQYHTGQEMHESNTALKFGLKVIAHMNKECERLGKRYNMHFVLEQTPAESTGYRMAKLDLKMFPMQASQVVKGNVGKNEVYYTNSTYLNVSSNVDPIKRVKAEGLFHPLVEAGALTHVWLGEARPESEAIGNFVTKTFRNTMNDQIAFSPEFTNCLACNKVTRGMYDRCSYCSSEKVEGITRVTGFFSKTSSWNKGKIAELRDRLGHRHKRWACRGNFLHSCINTFNNNRR